jgi:hypothetical protein
MPYGRFRWSGWPDAYEISAPAGLREDDYKGSIEGQLATFQARERGRHHPLACQRGQRSAERELSLVL